MQIEPFIQTMKEQSSQRIFNDKSVIRIIEKGFANVRNPCLSYLNLIYSQGCAWCKNVNKSVPTVDNCLHAYCNHCNVMHFHSIVSHGVIIPLSLYQTTS